MWPFSRRSKQINGPSNIGFDDTFMGVSNYRPVWENRAGNLPDPGARAYAWSTYALPAFTPIGAGNHAMSMRPQPFGPPPLLAQQGAITTGIPVQAGQFVLQPLLNPFEEKAVPKGYT